MLKEKLELGYKNVNEIQKAVCTQKLPPVRIELMTPGLQDQCSRAIEAPHNECVKSDVSK